MKLSRALVPLAAMALLLTGCSAGTSSGSITEDATGASCAVEGAGSKAVKIDGDFGGEMTFTGSAPVKASDKIERTVLIEGESDEAFAEGQNVTVNYMIFNGKTGELEGPVLDKSLANSAENFVGAEWAYEALRCGSVGQRTAIVTSVDNALNGEDPATQGFEGLEKTDAFVMVFDFVSAEEECEAVTPRDEKFPEVDLGDGSSEPKITIPECMEAPEDLEIKVLEEGDGEVVKDGDTVMTKYIGVDWNGADRFDGNWSETGVRFPTNGVIEGFKQAMVGQKIGSTVLATMPSELGYKDGMTRTFVLELVELTD